MKFSAIIGLASLLVLNACSDRQNGNRFSALQFGPNVSDISEQSLADSEARVEQEAAVCDLEVINSNAISKSNNNSYKIQKQILWNGNDQKKFILNEEPKSGGVVLQFWNSTQSTKQKKSNEVQVNTRINETVQVSLRTKAGRDLQLTTVNTAQRSGNDLKCQTSTRLELSESEISLLRCGVSIEFRGKILQQQLVDVALTGASSEQTLFDGGAEGKVVVRVRLDSEIKNDPAESYLEILAGNLESLHSIKAVSRVKNGLELIYANSGTQKKVIAICVPASK